MSDERCTVCGDETNWEDRQFDHRRYTVVFKKTCEKCATTLARALEKITMLLVQGNEEEQERAIARLFDRLDKSGFETEPPASNVLWFDPSVVREIR